MAPQDLVEAYVLPRFSWLKNAVGRSGFVPGRLAALAGFLLALSLGASGPARADSVIILNSDEASFSIISRSAMEEVGRVPVGREPHHLLPTPDRSEVVIASTVTSELLFLDAKTLQERRRIRNIIDPYQMSFSPDGKWLVTAALRMNHIDVYRLPQYELVFRLGVTSLPSHVMVDRTSKLAFISLQGSDKLMALDILTGKVAWEVEVGDTPAGVYVTPDNKRVLVGLTGDDNVAVVDIAKAQLVARISTGRGAHAFVGRGDGKQVFVSNRVEGTIATIDLEKMAVVDKIKIGGGPDCMDITPDGKQLWVTNRWARSVSVVDLESRTVIGRVKVGKSPHGVFISGSMVSNAR